MNFRPRLIITSLLAVLLPMIVLAFFIRGEMTRRISAQYRRRVESMTAVIEEDLRKESDDIGKTVDALMESLADDNSFRNAAASQDAQSRRYLIDLAGNVIDLPGLSMLQIQDRSGRIISSGHFRNEFDRIDRDLPLLLSSVKEGPVLAEARAPDSPFLVLARVDSFVISGRYFTVSAGRRVDQEFLGRLSREDMLDIVLLWPGGAIGSGDKEEEKEGTSNAGPGREEEGLEGATGSLDLPFIGIDRAGVGEASFKVTHRVDELVALRRSMDRWFTIALLSAAVFSIILVSWLSSRISRPLTELAEKTAQIDLEKLDVDFDSPRRDEIGALSRMLMAMTERLRSSAARIRDAEHRATLGELARQVNHDIKNGLTPIRNIFRHLSEIEKSDPAGMPGIFNERRAVLESSIEYLDDLASNYARLSPSASIGICDVNSAVIKVARELRASRRAEVQVDLADGAFIMGDAVAVRRVVENLAGNAADSLEDKRGTVSITTSIISGKGGDEKVRLSVSDTGSGMTEKEMAAIFNDFYTTKERGVGLGLSIVRRLVIDLGGSINVESARGKGSRFVVDIPRAARSC
ncbi:MAG: HAMP domain-containing histidine kinase [Candidatus Krumholzibacteriota bacterium]|nr:HAMP domain-containing histidine kinase [Candidatus Krumholzibacteriota bacterium]